MSMVDVIFVVLPLIIIVAAIGALFLIARWQRNARRSIVKLFITNEGNLRDRFNLRAESAGSELTFRFALNGASLPVTYTPAPAQAMAAGVNPPAATYAPAASEAPASYTVPEVKGPPLASLVADLLMGVGYILPGSAGQSLMGAASRIRYGQAVTDRAGKVAGRVGAVAGSTAKTSQQIGSTIGGGAAGPGPTGGAMVTQAVAVPSGPVITWWQTPFLEPGQALELGLVVTPTGASGAQAAGFRVVSRSAESGDAPVVANEATIHTGGPSGFGRWIPYISVVFLAVVALALLTTVRSLLTPLIGG
jgi:hypothetical protein